MACGACDTDVPSSADPDLNLGGDMAPSGRLDQAPEAFPALRFGGGMTLFADPTWKS